MGTTTDYKNEFGNQISVQQANQLGDYIKVFSENGIPNKKEFYSNNVLRATSYIVSEQSEIDDLLSTNPNASIEFNYVQFGYKIVEWRSYNNGIIVNLTVTVSNFNNQIIYYRTSEMINNTLTSLRTEKYYYDSSGQERYFFEYNSDGTCFKIYDSINDDSDIYAWSIGVDSEISFIWTGFEYYLNADPLIPMS